MHPLVFMFLALYSLSSISSRESSEDLRGFSIDLIHRDSPLSPFYNPSLTPSERITDAALSSSTETLSFDSTGGAQTVSFPNSIFGCGANNNLTFRSSDKATGLVGLVAGQLSLVSQLGAQIGYKFSYCLLPFSSTSTSKLKFGSEAIITTNGVVSTPLIIKPSLPSFTSSTLKSSPSAKRWCQRVESMTT
ncbi:hypothetical protein JHK85_022027 [Glycine max]|nr:hypothetical protein JHK85_022027 [Glycine max]